jgi:type II secretory pathway pseudopilin PulG
VIAIIVINATIVIPKLMRARKAAKDSSAAASVRSINRAGIAYFSTCPANVTPDYVIKLS